MVGRLLILGLTTAVILSSSCVVVSAEENGEFVIDQKVIDVIGGNGPVWVTIRDEKHYDYESQGYDRIFFEEDSQPFIDNNGRTQMPLRSISDELGFSVDWNESEKQIKISKTEEMIIFHLNSDEFTVNGEKVKMDTAPMLVNDITFIPLRFLGEALGYKVEYTDRSLVEDVPSITTNIDDMWNFDKYNAK